jgi:glycosyltransferase involved in cell wall biosynthesis
MEKITFCIPSKNNLRYLKNSIASIKSNSSIEHDIIVYVDMSQDGTEEWLIENNITYLKNDTASPKGIAVGYNRCIEAAKTNLVCMFHADMYMAKGFDIAIMKYIKPGVVVSGTRIEPPLHPPGKEKIIKDFGMYPEDFLKEEFNSFVDESIKLYKDKITQGIFAPWVIYKNDIESIGMHEESFHSYHEDSDIFNRFILSKFSIVQTWEALVYHLTCRGGQFQDGIEQVTSDAQFHSMKNNAARNYLRKWGSWIKNDEYQYPIIPHKRNIAFVVKNCNLSLLEALEPWCDRIYVDEVFTVDRAHDYIEQEQSNTKFDLRKRVLYIGNNYPEGENDVVVVFDANQFTQQSFQLIQNLSDIITDTNDTGEFKIDCLSIIVNNLETYERDLITVKH